jgi:hypothetical protein
VIYYGNVQEAGDLLLVQQGLYTGDWGVFGAFVAAPVGSFLWGFGALALRLAVQWVLAKKRGERFTGLDRPLPSAIMAGAGSPPQRSDSEAEFETTEGMDGSTGKAGKFF